MTNAENLRQKADPALAVWLAERLPCERCPAKPECYDRMFDMPPSQLKPCPEMLLEWLEKEMNEDETD